MTFRCAYGRASGHGIFVLHPDGRVASWNTGAERIKGWQAEEILG